MHSVMSSAGAGRGTCAEGAIIPPADLGGDDAESPAVTQQQPLASPSVDENEFSFALFTEDLQMMAGSRIDRSGAVAKQGRPSA